MPSLILSNPLGSDDAQRIGLSIREYAVGEIVTVNDFAAVTLIRTGYALAYGTGQDVLLTGDGPPNDSIGTDGQWYLDTQDEVLWGPKTGGYWPSDPIRPDRGVAHFAVDADGHLQMTYSTGTTVDLGRVRMMPRGPWAPNTVYAVDDLVTADLSTFRVTAAHTSGTTAPTRDAPGPNLQLWTGRPDVPNATTTAAGAIKISGDLAGTWDDITVPGLAAEATARDQAIAAEATARDQAIAAEATARANADAALIPLTQKGAPSGVATLDAGGLIPAGQLPAIAISDVFTAANQAAMLALTAQRGDVAIRTDGAGTFILAAEPATDINNWKQLAAAAGSGGGGTGSDNGTISVTGADGSVPFAINIVSNWGVTDAGDVYYDSAGAVAAEAGLLVPDPDRNGFAIFRPGGPWPTEDDRVATLIGQGAAGGAPASAIRAALDARYSVHFGAGTTLPSTGLKSGDTYRHTGLGCLLVYDAGPAAWRQVDVPTVADATARSALSATYSALLYPGFRVRQNDGGGTVWEWTGVAWAVVALGLPIAQIRQVNTQSGLAAVWTSITLDAAGVDIDTHAGWAAATPTRWTCPAGQAGTYRVWGIATVQNGAAGYGGSKIAKNGNGGIPGSASLVQTTTASGAAMASSNPVLVTLAVGDYVELQGFSSVASWSTRITGATDGLTSALTVERVR